MQMFAYRNTEAGIALRAVQAFETTATFEQAAQPFKPRAVVTPFKRIEVCACRVFRVSVAELRSQRRNRDVVMARQFIYYWATRLTPMSLGMIGRLMGDRDHTTIHDGKRAYVQKRAKMGRHLREVR